MVTSSDGYCTIIEFNPSELTEPLEQEAIDEHTKNVCTRKPERHWRIVVLGIPLIQHHHTNGS